MPTKDKYDLNDRLIEYSVLIFKMIDRLTTSKVASHLGSQLLRSASAPSLNYGEAQSVESKKDFIHKLRIILKELRESKNSILILNKYGSIQNCEKELQETNELIAIFTSSIETASKK
ncbi:four helix bundle protein [Reichenbachiella sp.]